MLFKVVRKRTGLEQLFYAKVSKYILHGGSRCLEGLNHGSLTELPLCIRSDALDSGCCRLISYRHSCLCDAHFVCVAAVPLPDEYVAPWSYALRVLNYSREGIV